jgi:hypothetical protein
MTPHDLIDELIADFWPACRDLLAICLFAGFVVVLGFALAGGTP